VSERQLGDGYSDDGFVGRLTAHLDRDAARDRGTAPDEAAPVPADLLAFTEELRADATWSGPPADLRDSILAAVRARPGAPAAAPAATPAARPRPFAGWRARFGRLTWAVPAVALAAAVFTAGVVAVDRALVPGPPRGTTYAVAGTQVAPRVTGRVSVASTRSGFSVIISFTGLPPATPGTYYAAWLRGPRGDVPLGSFHWRRGGQDVTLWSGVDPADYPMFVVTVQHEGAPPLPSTVVVVSGSLAR
jgi:hypothetical protein